MEYMEKKWKKSLFSIVVILVLLTGFLLYLKTGFLQENKINNRDLERWDYKEGLIDGSEEFEFNGNRDMCWLLIHSYTATPLEMKWIGERLNREFGNYVFGIRLLGHGEVPSNIVSLSLDDWYKQVEEKFEELDDECKNVNVVGSSFGGALGIKLSEEKEFASLYVLNGYLKPTYKFYHVFSPKIYINLFGNLFHYSKKTKVAKINDPEGLKVHVAYMNMPSSPVKNSQVFLETVFNDIVRVNENLLIQHSVNDDVASFNAISELYEKSSSMKKEIVLFENSNHILLMDYDSEEVIENIIEFEKGKR